MNLRLDLNADIIKLYQDLGHSFAEDMYLFEGLQGRSNFWKLVRNDLETHRKELESQLVRTIGDYTVEGARVGSEMAFNITTGILVEAGAKEALVNQAQMAIFKVNHEVVKASYSLKKNGLMLSDRIWGTSQHTRDVLGDLVTRGIASGNNSRQIGKAIVKYVEDGKAGIKEMLPELENMKGLPKNLEYNATRLAATEMTSAYGMTVDRAAMETPGVKGIGYSLSNSHPVYDICDVICGADDYGLGEGIYPMDNVPDYPFHPWCMCIKFTVMEDPDELIQRMREWVNDPTTHPDLQQWARGLGREKPIEHVDPYELMEKNGHLGKDLLSAS